MNPATRFKEFHILYEGERMKLYDRLIGFKRITSYRKEVLHMFCLKRIKDKTLLLACAITASLCLFGEARSQPKTLVIGHGGEPAHLFPHTVSQPGMDRVYNVSEPLVSLDEDAKSIPALATKWEVVEGKKWRFYLRRDVMFHNGERFSAKDVAFTIDYAKDPKNKDERRGLVKEIAYNIIDDYTIDIFSETGTINPVLPQAWFFVRILPKDTLSKMGSDQFSKSPVGTGPFQFAEWKRGEHIILRAFDKYWGGKAKIETIIYKSIPEAATRVVGLKTGDLDIISDVPPLDIKSIEADPRLEVRRKPSLYSMQMQLRCDIPPFKDNLNLRKAVGHAINSEAICREVLGGLGIPEGSCTPATAFGYNKEVKPYKYDPALAREYLKKSGYKGEEIKYVSSNGRYFMDIEVNTAIAGYLKAIGLNIQLELNDWPTWMDKYSTHKIEPIFLVGWADVYNDAVKNLFDAAHVDSPYNWFDKGGHPEFNKLVDTARTVLDPKIRREALEKANKILNDYHYYGMTYTPIKVYGSQKNVVWTPRLDEGMYVSNNAEKK
jgi:peptide/nickel transport system substrate-binding protein